MIVLRKTVRPSTNSTRYTVILATDDEDSLVGVRSGFGCSRMSSRSAFDVEDVVLAADAAGRPEFRIPCPGEVLQ
jgi:hypothetical protein